MVDRVITYDVAIPQATDVLQTNKMGMVGLAFLSRALLGSATAVHGLACAPTSPASLSVTIGPGSIYSLDEVDASAYGDLGTDTNTILKQGILYVAENLTITPPSTSGYSQVFLVQAIYEDVDAGSEVIAYYNPAILTNPTAQPYAGPSNDGMSQYTTRTGVCSVSLVAGVAATTGTQTTPAPSAGYTGLYAITVANGQATITSVNIVTLPTAPFFPTLPAIPSDVLDNVWVYALDTGVASSLVVSLASNPTAYAGGMGLIVKVAHTNTGAATINVNHLGAVPIISDFTALALQANDLQQGATIWLVYDATASSFRLLAGSPAIVLRDATFPYATFGVIGYTTVWTPVNGVITGVTGYTISNGDPNIIAGFAESNSLFTVPTGYDGLWMFQGYLNSLTSATTGQTPTNGFGVRLYVGGISGGQILSAANSPAATIVHGTVIAFANLTAGQTVQFAGLANDSGDNITTVIFTMIRLGRTSP